MSPPTAASKLSATWFFSAMAANAMPCLASKALLAVTTDFLAASAAETAVRAGSPSPPINSTNTSISPSVARVTGSATQRSLLCPISRFLLRERAVTATTSMARPQRAVSASCWRSMSRATHAPTVPKPAIPSFSGAGIVCLRRNGYLAPLGQGDDVVQLFRTRFKKAADIARGLTDALLVLHQRDAHVSFAVFAEADARRHRDLGLFDQECRKFDAAEGLERLGDRRPGEHGGARRRNRPARTCKGFHQYVAPALVDLPHVADAVVGTVERGCCGHLNRGEGAIIEIGFHPRERRDDPLVPDRKPDAPAWHRIGLRHRSEFDCHLHCAGHLQH